MQNEHGQGVSHATGDSKVPGSVQQKAPQGLEESLPNKVSSCQKPKLFAIHVDMSRSTILDPTLVVRPTRRTGVMPLSSPRVFRRLFQRSSSVLCPILSMILATTEVLSIEHG